MTELPNPYEPPGEKAFTSDRPPGLLLDARGRFIPASRGARLAGAAIDGVLTLALQYACGVFLVVVMYRELGPPRVLFDRDPELSNVTTLAASLIALAIQGALIARRGQSLGKIVLRTRIVHSDGRVANLYDGFVRRTLPVAGAVLGPKFAETMGTPAASAKSLGSFLGLLALIDAVMIFGSSSQCGHDRFAGTFVAKLAPRQESPPRAPPARARRKKRKPKKEPPPASIS